VYRGKSTLGRFTACAAKTVIYLLGCVANGIAYWIRGTEPAGFVLGVIGSIGKSANQFLDHTAYSDAAACGCLNKEEKGWWSWLMGWIFGDDDDMLKL
jgi:hypothetical protein